MIILKNACFQFSVTKYAFQNNVFSKILCGDDSSVVEDRVNDRKVADLSLILELEMRCCVLIGLGTLRLFLTGAKHFTCCGVLA